MMHIFFELYWRGKEKKQKAAFLQERNAMAVCVTARVRLEQGPLCANANSDKASLDRRSCARPGQSVERETSCRTSKYFGVGCFLGVPFPGRGWLGFVISLPRVTTAPVHSPLAPWRRQFASPPACKRKIAVRSQAVSLQTQMPVVTREKENQELLESRPASKHTKQERAHTLFSPTAYPPPTLSCNLKFPQKKKHGPHQKKHGPPLFKLSQQCVLTAQNKICVVILFRTSTTDVKFSSTLFIDSNVLCSRSLWTNCIK